MARTHRGVPKLRPSETTTKRPKPEPLKDPRQKTFSAELGLSHVIQIDEDSIMIRPDAYLYPIEDQPNDSPDAEWRDESEAKRCFKTVVAYEQIGENHPHIVPFKRRDPWTALPILAKPSGPPLENFLNQHREAMYSAPLYGPSSRILESHRPLAYQWTLHIISALAFVHSHDVIFGEITSTQCWLSSNLDLSLVGFQNSGFRDLSRYGVLVEGDHDHGYGFTPPKHIVAPTKETDLFWFASTVFTLMTGARPGWRFKYKTERELANMVVCRQWLPLEKKYMGEIVHKCWGGDFTDVKEVQRAIIAFLREEGWEIEGDDKLKGFVATDLFPQKDWL